MIFKKMGTEFSQYSYEIEGSIEELNNNFRKQFDGQFKSCSLKEESRFSLNMPSSPSVAG
jgi:hypothetical protein